MSVSLGIKNKRNGGANLKPLINGVNLSRVQYDAHRNMSKDFIACSDEFLTANVFLR